MQERPSHMHCWVKLTWRQQKETADHEEHFPVDTPKQDVFHENMWLQTLRSRSLLALSSKIGQRRSTSVTFGIGGCVRCTREILYWPRMIAEIQEFDSQCFLRCKDQHRLQKSWALTSCSCALGRRLQLTCLRWDNRHDPSGNSRGSHEDNTSRDYAIKGAVSTSHNFLRY